MNESLKHLAGLLTFSGEVATAIRMYSAYNQGNTDLDQHMPEDLMFLSDTLVNFEFLGQYLVQGNSLKVSSLCDTLAKSFGHYVGQPAFTRNPHVHLQTAIEHLAGLKAAVASPSDC